MRLAEWIEKSGLTQQQFAEKIGSSQPQVARFVAHTRMPSRDVMRRIARVTKGDVTADDFYELRAAS